MERSAIVLAGGFSSRFGQDKGVLELSGKPLIKHVLDAVKPVVNEIVVVTNSQQRSEVYRKIVGREVKFALDIEEAKGPLVGALTGFGAAQGRYCVLLPSDLPFVSRSILELFFELCHGRSAVIPRWPNAQIEPLHAVYHTQAALEAAEVAVAEGRFDLRGMIEKLRGVRYVSTLVVQELDPELRTFFNVNTPLDLKRAEVMLKPRRKK